MKEIPTLWLLADRMDGHADHDHHSRMHTARRIASLLGAEFGGMYEGVHARGHDYFVPDRTLLAETAARLGIGHPARLFGGVVPYPFMMTKAISHGTIDTRAHAPPGWSRSLGSRLQQSVLPGYTAFTGDDALAAVHRLLGKGEVRLKRVTGIGGTGQAVARNEHQAREFLATVSDREISSIGIVIERNLNESVTYSIGSVTLPSQQISYYGTQRCTRDRHGSDVYGGSDLVIVRGSFADLAMTDLPPMAQRALALAMQYDAEISRAYPQFFASRRNYDVLHGYDDAGTEWTGVLEQSWRYGGATPAEVSAFEAFSANPALHLVRASTHEVHADQEAPAGALVYYRDTDPDVGAMTKYCKVEPYGNPA